LIVVHLAGGITIFLLLMRIVEAFERYFIGGIEVKLIALRVFRLIIFNGCLTILSNKLIIIDIVDTVIKVFSLFRCGSRIIITGR
jgi:hypothetical protein